MRGYLRNAAGRPQMGADFSGLIAISEGVVSGPHSNGMGTSVTRSGALVGEARRGAGRSLAGHHGRTTVLGPNAARNDCGIQRDSLVIQCKRPLDVVGDCVNRRCDQTQSRGDPDHGRDANQAHERPSPAGLVRQASPAPFRSVPGIHTGRHCGCGMPMAASRSCCTTAADSEMSTGRIRDDHPETHGGDEARRALVPRGRPARGSVGPHKIIARRQAGRRPRLLQPDPAAVPRPRPRARGERPAMTAYSGVQGNAGDKGGGVP